MLVVPDGELPNVGVDLPRVVARMRRLALALVVLLLAPMIAVLVVGWMFIRPSPRIPPGSN